MSRLAIIGCLLVGCGAVDQQQTAWGSAKGDTAGSSQAPRVVVLAIDQATIDWAARTPSSFDGAPIGTPGPDKRFREVFARLADHLAALPRPPAVLTLSYFFPMHDGAPTRAMAEAFDRAPFPVVLSMDGDDFDPGVHSARRLIGHGGMFRDLVVENDEPTRRGWAVALDGPIVPAGLQPLSVVTRAAYLESACGVDPAMAQDHAARQAWAMGRSFTAAMTRKYVVFGEWQASDTATGIPLQPTDITELSAAQLLEHPDSPEVADLGGAVVIIGAYVGSGNMYDLYEDGQPVPGVLGHAWTAQRLVAAGCFL